MSPGTQELAGLVRYVNTIRPLTSEKVKVSPLYMAPVPVHFFAHVLRCLPPLLLKRRLVFEEFALWHSLDFLAHIAEESLDTLLQVNWITLALNDDAHTTLATTGKLPMARLYNVPKLFLRPENIEGRFR